MCATFLVGFKKSPPSAVTMHPNERRVISASIIGGGTSVRHEKSGPLSNDMTWRQMIGVGVRRVVLREDSLINSRGQSTPRGERSYAERREEQREQGIGQASSSSQHNAEESDARQRRKRQERERREWDDCVREVA